MVNLFDVVSLLSKQLFFIFILLGFSFITGLAVLRKFSFISFSERVALSTVTGWSMLSLLLEVTAFLGLFYFKIIIVCALIMMIFCIRHASGVWRDEGKDCLRGFAKWPNFLTLVVAGFIGYLFYLTFYLPLRWDAISYHLPSAKAFIETGRVCVVPYLRFPAAPQLADLLFALGLMSGDVVFANAISFIETLLLFFLLFAFTLRYFNARVAASAAILLLSVPVVMEYAAVPYAEPAAMLFCFTAFYATCRWFENEKVSDVVLAAVFWSLAFSTKYYAYLFFLAVFIGSFRRIFKREGYIFIAICLFMVLPWCLRSWVYTGDWFNPIFSAQKIDHAKHMFSFGYGKNQDFVLLPFRLALDAGRFQGCVGIFISFFAMAIFFVRKWNRWIFWMFSASVFYIVVWFYNFQIARYLAPILPLAAVLAGWSMDQVGNNLSMTNKGMRHFLIFIFLLLAVWFPVRVSFKSQTAPLDSEGRKAYLKKNIETMGAIEYLNSLPPGRVYTFHDERPIFYHKNPTIGDWMGVLNYQEVTALLKNGGVLSPMLKSYGVRYFLVNKLQVKFESLGAGLLLREQGMRLIYQGWASAVYEVL
jgi:hypothetical protein